MAQGISPNPLNDISKAYLELVAKINKDEEEKVIEKWDDSSVNKVDPDLVLKVESKRTPATVVNTESYSDWRNDLREIVAEPEEKAEKEVIEKKGIKNKVTINPKLGEAVAEIGGQLLEVKEIDRQTVDPAERKEDPSIKSKENRQKMLKKQVLLRKLQAVRQGAGADITASYEPDGEMVAEYDPLEDVIEYFYEEGINEEGFDQLIEEIGLEEFVDFVEGGVVELTEARSARKASVRAKKYDVVKKEVDKADAAKRKAKKGEYAPSYAKKETDVTVYDDKPAAKKKAVAKKTVAKKAAPKPAPKKAAPKPVAKKPVTKKVVKAVAKVKKTQPVKKATKQGLGDKIRSAYKAGVKRHRKATQGARVFGKGFASGAKKAVKFAKDVKKVVSEEELAEAERKLADRLARKRKLYDKTTKKAMQFARDEGEASGHARYRMSSISREMDGIKAKMKKEETEIEEAKVDKKLPDYKRATARDKRYGNPYGSHELGGGIRKDRRADHENRRGVKEGSAYGLWKGDGKRKLPGDKKKKKLEEKDLNAAERRALPNKDFVFPGKGEGPEGKQRGAYPIPDKKHARNALAMAAAHASPEKQAKVKAAVKKKFPGIKVTEDKALEMVKAAIIKKHGKGAIYDGKSKPKPPSEAEKKKAAAERKKRQDADNKAYAARAKKAGFKSTQDYTNVVARYGSEDNYRRGKGLGT